MRIYLAEIRQALYVEDGVWYRDQDRNALPIEKDKFGQGSVILEKNRNSVGYSQIADAQKNSNV